MECDICHSAQHSRRECPKVMEEAWGPSTHLAQTGSDLQYVDWQSLLADPADGSAILLHFMAARHLCAGMTLENYADELFKDVFTGRGDIDLAEWL
eukprot:8880439-Pyramimonas_sp.AAC.1